MQSGAHLTKPTDTQKHTGIPALGFPVVVVVQNNLTQEPATRKDKDNLTDISLTSAQGVCSASSSEHPSCHSTGV